MFLNRLRGYREKRKKAIVIEKIENEKIETTSGLTISKIMAQMIVLKLKDLKENHYSVYIDLVQLSRKDLQSLEEAKKFSATLFPTGKLILPIHLKEPISDIKISMINDVEDLQAMVRDSVVDGKIVSPQPGKTLMEFLEPCSI